MKDSLGLPLTGASGVSLDAYQRALDQFRCLVGDPAAEAERAITASPAMPMAHLLKAWLNLLGTDAAAHPVAQAACMAAARLALDERESLHLKAATHLCEGQWTAAARVLEDLTIRFPRDLLALQVGHQIDYFTGDARMLRDRVARVLPRWDRGMPGYHAVLGMHAFGLEETGNYAGAERQGRLAVELEPRDGWAWHAVAHVHEMRNEPKSGLEWLGADTVSWSDDSFFAVHNWWHMALFQLELGDEDEALRLYDEAIANGSEVTLDLVDASAMLWRLQLRGMDLGARWDAVADRWQACGVPGLYAFNDLHMLMAYIGAGRESAVQAVLRALREAVRSGADNARFTREVGLPAGAALEAFAQGRFRACADLLRDIRSQAHRFGGSHAQRDLLDLTLLAAAERSGQEDLARALQWERQALRPRSTAGHLALAA